MYSRLHDPHGHVAVGVLACVIEILTNLVSMQGDLSESFFDTFTAFVRLELEVRYFVDVNTGEYRDVVDHLVSQSSDNQSCAYLLRALQTKSADELELIFGVPVTFHTTVSAGTLQGLIRDSINPKAEPEGLHFAVAHSARDPSCTTPLPGGMSADIDHHILVVWMTHLHGVHTVS